MNHETSNGLYDRALSVIPGGLMSNLKRSDGFAPSYKVGGRGARLMDVDGNEYIDFNLSYGSAILGHSDEHVRDALRRQVEGLSTFHSVVAQIEAAERLCELIPSAEMVRFSVSGIEANRAALRLARAATGRNQYVRFQGHYHGQVDHLMGGVVSKGEWPPVPREGVIDGDPFTKWMSTAGRARDDFQQVFQLDWNDLDSLERLFESHGNDIAAVITEPVMLNFGGCRPASGYLEGLRRLCTRYGVVLIFDEVLTGFRIGLSGAQGHFGVTPDLTTFGKALGGGMPVAAVCGAHEIMSQIATGEVVEAGTFNGHPMSMAAVLATIDVLSESGGDEMARVHASGARLRAGLENVASTTGHSVLIQGFDGCLVPLFTDRPAASSHPEVMRTNWALAGQFSKGLLDAGVEYYGRFCTSAAHTDTDIDDALATAQDVLDRIPVPT